MLNKYQIDPTCLEIEITEEVCLEDTEQVINLLNKIRSLGIRLALDDIRKRIFFFTILSKLSV